MNKESLKKELQPYYQKGDCCSWIVELRKECSEKDKEIERLNKELEEYKKDYDRIYTENCKLREKHNITDISLLDENYRLNNIINELEKYFTKPNKFIERPERMKILDKLKALKEDK